MFCLDTNIIVGYLRGDENVINKIKEVTDYEDIFVTTISLCELYRGAYLSPDMEKELVAVEGFISSCELLGLDEVSCKQFGKQYAILKRKGSLTQESDLMIASIVKANNMVFVTKNKKHFQKIYGLQVEGW